MMTPEQADRFAGDAAAYVHIPFCGAICPYCDFAVVAGRDESIERYIEALCIEIGRSEPWRPLAAVYFGGGTPSRVPAGLLGRVLGRLRQRHGLTEDAEISIECNPEDFDVDGAASLRAEGFNRVSFGAQSFDRTVLAGLGRRHGPEDIRRAVGASRDAGFENVSVDLIFGTPGESDASWVRTVEQAVGLDVTHVSCYALTVERGTALGRAVRDGAAAPDPDTQADRYEMADGLLAEAGLNRYEVSNWSRPGYECRYNMVVWAQGEYEGYGNGAHGFRGGRRFRKHRSLDAYLRHVEGGSPPLAGEDRMSGWDSELDRLFVGLRRAAGVAEGPGTSALCSSPEGRALFDAGVMVSENGRLRVVRPLMTDAVNRSVLAQIRPNVGSDDDA